ncbi:hypothetical protein PVNG_06449 [Plasmodium vivax North Korean]|uniref:VIR protein n=1 Tax=Plasmodium vivax North Korean TaxID=1035514 RepID=A0A0J9TLB9_PLAVI|nr:hypothetical protein PVNG_06449 [Plasmodium vivax North Korean]
MKSLYGLYDEFISLKQKYNSTPNCDKFPSFVHQFNDFVRNIKDNESDFFKNKLKNFIEEIKKHPWTTNKECGDGLSKIASLNPEPPVETVIYRSPNPASSFQSASISSSDSQSIIGGERLSLTNVLESSEIQSTSGKEPAKETMSPKGSLQSAETQDNSVTLHTTEEEQSIKALKPTALVSPNREHSTLKAKAKPHEQYTHNLMHIKGQYYPELSSHQQVLEIPNIENDTLEEKGYLRTVTEAVSGFMKDVEPAPILGVSGGMGALFLLFKVFIALKIYF